MPEKTRTAQSGYESSVVLVVKTALAPGQKTLKREPSPSRHTLMYDYPFGGEPIADPVQT
ncbi:MAG: hypothetical protein ACLP51_04740 [Syntrophobacteraceae bacterium]